jgi:hypothetical protein
LEREGFRTEDISVLFAENQGTKDFAHEKGTKAPEGAATSEIVGSGLLSWQNKSIPYFLPKEIIGRVFGFHLLPWI